MYAIPVTAASCAMVLANPSPAAMKVVEKLISSTVCKTSLSKNSLDSLSSENPEFLYVTYKVKLPLSDSSSVI